jgi:hypothetical protein
MFVNMVVTTLQVIVQKPIWSVAVVRLIPVVAQMDHVQQDLLYTLWRLRRLGQFEQRARSGVLVGCLVTPLLLRLFEWS